MLRPAIAFVVLLAICVGCQKDTASANPTATEAASAQGGGGGGNTVVSPEVGGVAPVTHASLDDASGGGVGSSMMKKAKGIAAEGVGSVNNAQKQGYDSGNDTGTDQ